MKKQGEKIGGLINEKPPNPVETEEENRVFCCFTRGEKPSKPN